MKLLIIGGNRFMGRLLAERLLGDGHAVTLLNRGNLEDPFGDRVERLRGDRTSPDLERLLGHRTFDVAVDFAAFTAEDGRRLAAALDGRVGHLLLVSTGQVYLVREGCPRPSREQDYDGPLLPRPADPRDLADWEYGMGKRGCEDALRAAWRDRGFPATAVRIPMVHGALDHQRRLERYLARLADGGPVLVPDGGDVPVRHVDAGEVARFLAAIAGRRETFGEAYNLAQEETPSLRELLEACRALLGSAAPLVAAPRAAIEAAGLDPVLLSPFSGRWMSLLDPARAREALGFRHAPLAGCLARIVEAFRARAPAAPPAGLDRRADELALCRRLAR